ncbi:MAG: hypothetical protein WAJ95_00940 [Desulfobacterales bacterium]
MVSPDIAWLIAGQYSREKLNPGVIFMALSGIDGMGDGSENIYFFQLSFCGMWSQESDEKADSVFGTTG